MSSTSFTHLPIDILAMLSSLLYAKAMVKLYRCGDKRLNAKLCWHGGMSALRYHFGNSKAFDSRGVEHRGHYTPVPLHFPVDGIDGGLKHDSVGAALVSVSLFSTLRVLSIYNYRQYSKLEPRIVQHLTLEVMNALPKVLEVIEFRFFEAIAPFLKVRSGQNVLRDVLQDPLKTNPFLPMAKMCPALRCLSIWCDWETLSKWNKNQEPIAKFFVENLPATLEELSADFLPLIPVSVPTEAKHARFHTFVSTCQSRLDWGTHAEAILSALPAKTLTRLDLPHVTWNSREHIALLPPLLQSLELAFLVVHDEPEVVCFPFPPDMTRLVLGKVTNWSVQDVAKIPYSVEVLHIRKLEQEQLMLFATMSARSFGCDSFSQPRATVRFNLDDFSVLPSTLRHLRIALSPAFRTTVVFSKPFFTSLQTLVLTGGHITDSCISALSDSIRHLSVESIRMTGALLPEDTIILDEAALVHSVKNYFKTKLPLVQAIPKLTCVSLTQVPPNVEQIVGIDYTNIPIRHLPKLKVLSWMSNVSHFMPSTWKGFPASLTLIDLRGSQVYIQSNMLEHAPKTLTKIAGGTISCYWREDESIALKSIACTHLKLPENFAQTVHQWSHIELVDGCSVSFGSRGTVGTIASLPILLEELTLLGSGLVCLQESNLTELPHKSMMTTKFALQRTAFFPNLKRVNLQCGAVAHYPLDIFPQDIEELHLTNHRISDVLVNRLSRFKALKTLTLGGTCTISEAALKNLPRSLSSLTMDFAALSEAGIPNLPPSLTHLKLHPDSSISSAHVLECLAQATWSAPD